MLKKKIHKKKPARIRFYFNALHCSCLFIDISIKKKMLCSHPQGKIFEADNCYLQLMQNEKHQKYRDRWLKCIEKFQEVYTRNPDNAWASAGMYRTAQLFMELYKRSYEERDRAEVLIF